MNSDKQPCGDCPLVPKDRRQKQVLIETTIKRFSGESDRQIASRLKVLGTDHKTVAKHYQRLVASGEIPQTVERLRKDGRKRPTFSRRPEDVLRLDDPVYTCLQGENDELMKEVSRLYFRPGMRIADVTWGRGTFWKQIDTTQYDFLPSDIATHQNKIDCTSLPYGDASLDAVVFDPPYIEQGKFTRVRGRMVYADSIDDQFRVSGLTYDDVISLYRDGIEEATRVLADGGLLCVKVGDEALKGTNCFTHVTVHEIALSQGLRAQDLFILLRRNPRPPTLGLTQHNARKNHSFLWVFQKK